MLLLYTDGLVERRGASLTDGLDRLAAAAVGSASDPELACDEMVRVMLGDDGPADDVAVLAVAIGAR